MPGKVDQVPSLLSSGILESTSSLESCVVIIPSSRLKSGQIALLLKANGVEFRVLGHGSGKVKDIKGNRRRVRGLLILAVPNRSVKLVKLYTGLYGANSVTVSKYSDILST